MSVTILAQTAAERMAFRQALGGHVPGLIEVGDFSAVPQLALADTVQVVVIEHRIPETDGLVIVDWLRQRRPRLPLVLVVAGGETSFAVQAIRRGLADYVPREHLEWLGPVVREWVLAPWSLCRPHRHLEELGLLVGPTIHELNNILTPLRLGLDLLHNPMNLERRDLLLDALTESVQRGAELVGQVLECERLRRQDCSWMSLDELAQRLIEERQTPDRPMTLGSESPLPPVWADSIQMYHMMRLSLQVLQREWVVDETPERQAPLRIELRQRERTLPERNPFGRSVDGWIQINFTLPNHATRPAAVLPTRPLDTCSRQPGFDLLMARGIVRRHHGRIDLVNHPDEGFCLTIWLPIVRPEEDESGDDFTR